MDQLFKLHISMNSVIFVTSFLSLLMKIRIYFVMYLQAIINSLIKSLENYDFSDVNLQTGILRKAEFI